VIVVQVRQQDRRDAVQARSGLRHRPGPTQDAHPIPQKRIGEQADVVQLEKHGRVAQPCDLHQGIHFDGGRTRVAMDTATESFTVAVFTHCALLLTQIVRRRGGIVVAMTSGGGGHRRHSA
jgi:hypothetical protein